MAELDNLKKGKIVRVRTKLKPDLRRPRGYPRRSWTKITFRARPAGVEINIRALPTATLTQDLKNLIRDKRLSERLLQADLLPSFAECVDGSSTELPREEDKDNPRLLGWRYNHFLQAAAILSVDSAGENLRQTVAYYRRALPGLREHTPGLAILWGASFVCRVREYFPSRMDYWMEDVRCCSILAQDSFVAKLDSVLAHLLYRKIHLEDVPLKIVPYAVVTNDQRDESTGTGRVYTQYVFDVRLPA